MIVIYSKSNGEVSAIGEEIYAGPEQKSAEVDGRKITKPITGTRVDDIENPTETVRDDSLLQEDDYEDRRELQRMAELKAQKNAIEEEISQGNVPGRSSNANVDAVLADIESRIEECRKCFR